ncbi:hypothetical protein COCSADRAFT_182164 [Bipolaris sorokiniana ND90Pr]|uniref:Uncharacterized protein n=1 Tax=Cochliobolus sativus (strain ND90Pr / ATCC 201652) TaxID=665912 RepID=M2T0T8_COCSN|nr:uncharacterized protein COCSADRAFT_182164 [Bipolaris sorokiniana ND90Pr]EMD62831.1 hypothetical protein COCSADRAFT_182164 [Bipolaris sorokiniana ND90Pr]
MIIDLNKILLLLAAAGTIHAGIIRANEDVDKRAPTSVRVWPRQPQESQISSSFAPFLCNPDLQICGNGNDSKTYKCRMRCTAWNGCIPQSDGTAYCS